MDEISQGILARFDSGVAERIVEAVIGRDPIHGRNIAKVLNATILRRARRGQTLFWLVRTQPGTGFFGHIDFPKSGRFAYNDLTFIQFR